MTPTDRETCPKCCGRGHMLGGSVCPVCHGARSIPREESEKEDPSG